MLNDTLKSLLFILFFVSVPNLNAKTLSYRHFSVEDGLPSSEVYDVLEDDQGFMWFATDRGAVRFDGYEFEVFNTDKGLPDNVVLSLFKDYKGRIWFAGYSGKLSYFENDEVSIYPYNYIISEQVHSPLTMSIYLDSNDCLHLGYFSEGYLKIYNNGKFKLNQKKPDHIFNLVKVENTLLNFRTVHMASSCELKLRILRNDVDYYYNIEKATPNFLPISHVSKILSDGTFYFSIGKTLYCSNGKIINIIYTGEEKISVITANKHTLMIGSYKDGYMLLNRNSNHSVFFHDLTAYSVSKVFEAEDGGIWVATLENGIFYSSARSIISLNQMDGLCASEVYELAGDNESLVVSDLAGSVSILDINTLKLNTNFLVDFTAIHLIHNPFNNKIYLSSSHKIQSVNNKIKNWNVSTFVPFCFIEEDIFFGVSLAQKGLAFGEHDNFKFTRYNTNHDLVYQANLQNAYYSISNRLLLGCKDGLRELIHPSPEDSVYYLKNWGEANSLFKTRIIEITDYPGFDFIAATRGEGLLFVRNNIPYAFKMKQGLLSNQITSIFVDDELSIWIGSSEGLSILKKTGELINLSIKDGLISNEVTDIYVNEKNAFIGTKKGLTVLDKDEIKKHINDIPVLFRSIKNQHDVEIKMHDGKLDVAYKEPIISLSYAGIHFPSMGRISYRYRLNANENWLYTKNHELLLTNLPSGKYELEIYASNDNTNWSSVPARLSINIAYPFWQTWAFIIIMIFAGMITLYLIYRLIIRRIRNKEKIKRQIQNLRFEALSAQMNPHFMFNSLNSIQNFIMNNDRKSSTRYLSKFAKLMRNTLEHSKLKHITLSEEIETLSLYLELESLRFDHLIKYTINISDELNPNRIIFPALLIQPMVENAILHGLRPRKTGGKIDVFFERKDSSLIISVSDDGVGRNYKDKAENHHQSSGTKLTIERISLFAKEHNSRFSFNITDRKNNNSNSGTTVHITIPYIITHENKNHNY